MRILTISCIIIISLLLFYGSCGTLYESTYKIDSGTMINRSDINTPFESIDDRIQDIEETEFVVEAEGAVTQNAVLYWKTVASTPYTIGSSSLIYSSTSALFTLSGRLRVDSIAEETPLYVANANGKMDFKLSSGMNYLLSIDSAGTAIQNLTIAGYGDADMTELVLKAASVGLSGYMGLADGKGITVETIQAVDATGIIINDKDGNLIVTFADDNDIDVANNINMLSGKTLNAEIIKAVDSTGILIKDDSGTLGIFVADGANIGLRTSDIEAWQVGYTALEFFNSAIMAARGDETLNILSNAYYDGDWKYKGTNPTSKINLYNGEIRFGVAASGTVDAVITFLTPMIIEVGGDIDVAYNINMLTGKGITVEILQAVDTTGVIINDKDGNLIFTFADDNTVTAAGDISTTATVTGGTIEGTIVTDGTGVMTGGAITGLTTPLTVAQGGTGASSLTDGGLLVGNATGAIVALGVATNGQIPIGDGTTAPVLANITGTANRISVFNGVGTIGLSTPQDMATASSPEFAGLTITSGGTIDIDTIGATFETAIEGCIDTLGELTLTGDLEMSSGFGITTETIQAVDTDGLTINDKDGNKIAEFKNDNNVEFLNSVGIGTAGMTIDEELHIEKNQDGATRIKVENTNSGAYAVSGFSAVHAGSNDGLYMQCFGTGYNDSALYKADSVVIYTSAGIDGGFKIMAGGDGGLYLNGALDGATGMTIETDGSVVMGGSLQVGDSTDNVTLDTDGIVLSGDARKYEDLRFHFNGIKTGGLSDPDFVQFKTDGAGSTGVYVQAFDAAVEEELFFNAQMPEAWDAGTTIEIHVHWTPSNTNTGAVVWGLEYTWANIEGTYGNTTIMTAEQTASGTSHQHHTCHIGQIAGTSMTESSILTCRVFRDADDADEDDYNADALGLELDFHYIVEKNGGDLSIPIVNMP